jgi:hypothetical protein
MMLTSYTLQPWPVGRYTRYRARNSCVRNAWCLASDHSEMTIVKGYAKGSAGLWIGHWWCVDAEGKVVDPSWKNVGTAYVGMETVDVVELARQITASGYWDLALDHIAHPDLEPLLEAALAER